MRFLYLLAVYLAAPVISGVFLWRGLRDRSYWRNFGERFGFGAAAVPHGVWIHAASVGEVQACASLVGVLRQRYPDLPLTVTAVTPTGAARARALFGSAAQVRYVPFDLPGAVRRFFTRLQPRLAVIFETELWPNLYRECGRRRVPLVLASARVSPRSAGRYRRLGALFREEILGLDSPYIREVRGMGLLNAIVIDHPQPDAAWQLCLALKENGLLAKPTHGDKIRLAPPLVITRSELLECVEIVGNSLAVLS